MLSWRLEFRYRVRVVIGLGGLTACKLPVARAHDTLTSFVRPVQRAPSGAPPKHAELCANAAAEVVGSGNVLRNEKPSMGSEDFSFLLNASEGAYIWIGNGLVPEDGPEGGCMLHNTEYDFNDEILPLGSSYWVQLVQGILK